MSDKKVCIVFVILTLISNRFVQAQQKAPAIEVLPTDWEVVAKGWPIEDYFDGLNEIKSQFYYYDKPEAKSFKFKLNDTFLNQINNEKQLFKISFKLWAQGTSNVFIIVRIDKRIDEQIYETYNQYFSGQWMRKEYVLTFDELKSFSIECVFTSSVHNYRISAFKDFKIEYQTQINSETTTELITGYSSPSLTGWKIFKTPPNDDGLDRFIYFGQDCSKGCSIDLNKAYNPDSGNLIFKYWISGPEVSISVNGEGVIPSDQDKSIWITTLPININSSQLRINVTTGVDSFAAIKDVSLTLVNSSTTIECINEDSCSNWAINPGAFWAELGPLDYLTEYYFPTVSQNQLTFDIKDTLNDANVCLNITYLLSDEKDIKLNINYSVEGEVRSESILEIRPKIRELESTEICLRQLLASNAQNYSITFNSEQTKYESNANNLLIRVEVYNSTDSQQWNFNDEIQTFLLSKDSEKWQEQIWPEIPLNLNNLALFKKLTNSSFEFSGITKSRIPSSVYLSSPWIKYNKNLHNTDPEYNIKVANTEDFTRFTIIPKICDWLSHCEDVLLTANTPGIDTTSRDFSFKFPELKSSDYLRLVFYVEYFKPLNSQNDLEDIETVKFELKLVHFGDPCFVKNLENFNCNNGTCTSNPKISIPNQPKCECDPGYEGQNCKEENFCDIAINSTGNTVCANLGTVCESLTNDFRCICNQNYDIIWNRNKTQCQPIEPDISGNWTQITDKLYPNNSENSLIYKFSNIKSTEYDVCLEIQYFSSKLVDLKINFITDTTEQKPQELPELSLNEATNSTLELCLSDFYYTNREDFKLEFKIKANFEKWDETSFHIISLNAKLKEKTDPKQYLNRWDINVNKSGPNPAIEQNWKTIPANLFTKSTDDQTLYFNFSGSSPVNTTDLRGYFISDWIKNDTNFRVTDNYFSILFPKDTNSFFKIEQGYIFVKNDEDIVIEFNTPQISDRIVLKLPTDQSYPFKIIFRITVFNRTDETNEVNIQIYKLSLGDPCFIDKKDDLSCKNDGQCVGSAPKQFTCDCTNDYAGPVCQLLNSCKGEEEYCSGLPSLPISLGNKCKVLDNTTYECICPPTDYSWNSSAKRCLRYGHLKHWTKCLGNDCEMFDTLLENTRVSNKNLPVLKKVNDPILPFYYSNKNNTKINFNVKELSEGTDICFGLQYQISKSSTLDISYQELAPIQMTTTQTTNNTINWFPNNEQQPENICVSTLTKTIDKDFNITFNAEITDPNEDILVIHFKNNSTKQIDYFGEELPYLTHWSQVGDLDNKFNVSNQWTVVYPSLFWRVLSNPLDSFGFKYYGSETPQKSYLISNWINKTSEDNRLRFKLSKLYPIFEDLVINVIAFNDKMEQAFNKEIKPNREQIYNIPIGKIGTAFRIGFIVECEYPKQIDFRIESIDFGDPCIDDKLQYNDCSGNGICNRIQIPGQPKLQFECNCTDKTYTGTYCEARDYCYLDHVIKPPFGWDPPNVGSNVTNGNEYCNYTNDKCINEGEDSGFGNFRCHCDQDKYWNFNYMKCRPNPKCLTMDKPCNYATQVCKEGDGDEEAKCVCKEGFVQKVNSTECEVLDPCNNDHRSENNLGKACLNHNTVCMAYGNELDQFLCVCEEGFKTVKSENISKTECTFIACSFPTLNNCSQECIPNKDLYGKVKGYNCTCNEKYYELDKDEITCRLKETNDTFCDEKCTGDYMFCNKDDKCVCKNGFKRIDIELNDGNNKSYQCIPDSNLNVTNICPYGLIENTTSKLACKCEDIFELDPLTQMCKLRKLNDENNDKRKECNEQGALGYYDESGQFTCDDCPKGKEKNSIKTEICVNVCEYKNPKNDKTRNEMCEQAHLKCNPLLIINNSSYMAGDELDETNLEQFCECEPGYIKSQTENKCLILEYVSQFILSIKNIFNEGYNYTIELRPNPTDEIYYDLEGFTANLKSVNDENKELTEEAYKSFKNYELQEYLTESLKPVLKRAFNSSDINITTCSLNEDFYDCTITVSTSSAIGQDDKILKKLNEVCMNITGTDSVCFFLSNEPKKSRLISSNIKESDASLVINKQKLQKTQIKRYSNCESSTDICSIHPFTTCNDTGRDDSYYSCQCNPVYFLSEPKESLPISGAQGKDALAYKCTVDTGLCKTQCSEDSNCTQTLPYKNQTGWFVAPVNCQCKDGYTHDSELIQCVGVCNDHNCEQGECKPLGDRYACTCYEGWGGDECNVKYALGGWIAGITVLVVLVVALAAIAFIFAKRAKRFNNSVNNNNIQPLNEYSPTSYRVGQNQYNNEGFTRD